MLLHLKIPKRASPDTWELSPGVAWQWPLAATALKTMTEPNWKMPEKPKKEAGTDEDIFKMDATIWIEEYKEYKSKCAA